MAYKIVAQKDDTAVRGERKSLLIAAAKARIRAEEGWEVSVTDGEVTLDGVVENRAEKGLAEDCADSVPGVVDVHNHLRIRHADE